MVILFLNIINELALGAINALTFFGAKEINNKERAIKTLKHRNYSDYERLMILHIKSLYAEVDTIQAQLNIKLEETRKELIELSNIQSMLLNEDVAYKYYDIATKLENVNVNKESL